MAQSFGSDLHFHVHSHSVLVGVYRWSFVHWRLLSTFRPCLYIRGETGLVWQGRCISHSWPSWTTGQRVRLCTHTRQTYGARQLLCGKGGAFPTPDPDHWTATEAVYTYEAEQPAASKRSQVQLKGRRLRSKKNLGHHESLSTIRCSQHNFQANQCEE